MQVINCKLQNFASYKELEFNFENQGLTLIQGPTGAGKSTLCDVVPWVLFGRTAKDGAVDEVRSWNADGTTYGHVILDMGDYSLWIARTRSPNDLYYVIDGVWEHPKRGKDINDTQKLINSLLGFDVNTYLAGSYFHEFSQTAQFFITTAKNRRAICEQLVDLSLAKTLQTKLSDSKKELDKIMQEYAQKIQLYADRIQQLEKQYYKDKAKTFIQDKDVEMSSLMNKMGNALSKKTSQEYIDKLELIIKIESAKLVDTKCTTCGAPIDHKESLEIDNMKYELNKHKSDNQNQQKIIDALYDSYEKVEKQTNTFAELEIWRLEKLKETQELQNVYANAHGKYQADIADIELLQEIVNDFRGITIKTTIKQLEDGTNALLSNHFDAEIRVLFEVIDADKLDVTIYKDGNICSYTQLSKGQRQLLKLCFGVSVMRSISNHQGVNFNCLFFDEAVDGMDDNFRIKTFRLLEELALEHESVFVVDHSEALKSMFVNKYSVELINGNSVINGA